MLGNDWLALIVTLALALAWLRLNDYFAQQGWIGSRLSRKIIHIGTGPIFVLCWLLFTDSAIARYLAALIPLAITAQFALVGSGLIQDPAAVAAMSRSGDRREILRGPLFYGIVFVLLTILFWRNSPVGIIALMLLCGGDGLADVFGWRGNGGKLPWSDRKSWLGSLAMFGGGWLFAALVLGIYLAMGYFSPHTVVDYLPAITGIALVATIVESFPVQDIDNLTVPAVAILLGTWWMV